jgi:hypothetical protein
MVTFPFTSVEAGRRRRATAAFALLLALGAFGAGPLLRAGSVITLGNGSQSSGKLSIAAGAIHAEGPFPTPDTALSDVLESTFDDAPFALNVYRAGKINQLPPNWSAKTIGEVDSPGSVNVQDGTFTVIGTSSVRKNHDDTDHLYFISTPWLDDGQFTARLASLDASGDAWSGLMFRGSLDNQGPSYAAMLNGQGQISMPVRNVAGGNFGGYSSTGDAPIWLRFTREGNAVLTSTSSDGTIWDIIGETSFKTLDNALVGLTSSVRGDKGHATAAFDNLSVTPLPSSAQVLTRGVLLQGGSLLAASVSHLSLDPSAAEDNGDFVRDDKKLPIPRSAIAGVIFLPMERKQLETLGSKPGVALRNGDTMDGDVTEIAYDHITVSSVLLGISTYKPMETRACFLAPLQVKPAAYEVRLRDGSILNATAVTGDATGVAITDVSGVNLHVGQDEIAQIRAGSAVVLDLAPLAWKATAAKEAGPAQVDTWLGKDQQQILETDAGTAIEFPLPGKFRAFGVQVVLGSESPANATAVIHFLTDGHELAKSPPLRAGDAPRYMDLSLPTASRVTVQAESMFPGTKVLYLDPVGIR